MTTRAHLWAIGYDDMGRAEQIRAEVVRLGKRHCLILRETSVVVCYPDGSMTLDGEPFVAVHKIRRHTFASLLAGLALGAPPLTGPAAGVLLRATGAAVGLSEEFVCEVGDLIKPGTSAVFVVDQEGDMGELLQGIQGLGGKVLKTNVDLERAKLIQATLAAAAADGQ